MLQDADEEEEASIMESEDEGSYEHVQNPVEEEKKQERRGPAIKGILKRNVATEGETGRNVTFRTVLADYVEPVPVNVIDDEEYANVLDSYKQLCAKLRVRPCQKLVDQLEGLRDSTLKLDTIDLKGTRLDPAHCEALEAVLRVLRAQTLNIEQTQLDDDGAISVFEMIEYYEPVTRLIVANNVRLGVRAWLALARLLKRFHRLEYLDVRRTSLDESTMPLLCRVLKLNCTLRVLHLEDNHLSGILTRNLVWGLRTNTLLQDLYLGHNKLTPEDAKLLGSLLITNRTIRLLDLRNNRLQDTGVLFLSSALEEQASGLQLITVWSNQITANSMSALGRALAFHTTLEGVNLGSNALGNKGVECLKEGLLSSRSIARLVMASCNITNEGAVVMAEIVGDHTTLIHLDLRENNISLAGVMALKCAYAINHKLLRLHLDVMKRSNNDDLMQELLAEIEAFSVRNLEAHKNADQCPLSPEGNEIEGDSGISRSEQEQADYELAMKLQKEEREKCNNNNHSSNSVTKPEERRALPIISPPMAPPPDPTKTFGFFSGHYIKLKQRWDESIGVYINKGDISLAASPGNTESYSTQHNNEEEDDQFVDAVEEQSARSSISSLDSPTSPTSPEFDSPPDTVDLLYDDSPLSGTSPPPLGSPLPGGISFFDSPLSDITSTESSQSDPLIPENSLNSEDYLNHHVALKRNTVSHSRYEYSDSLSNTSSECTNNTSECSNNTSECTNNTSECSNNTSECTNNTSSEYTNTSPEYTNSSSEYTNSSPANTSTADETPDCTPSPTECSSDVTSADDRAISSTDCSSDTASEVNDIPPVYYTGH
ncbi:protein phosphatase 1 regulatory subunit 37-like [Bolinopsis microptera]|uniref:protein phosphatase 1 regulatory subunit 37-like n=1 Tax=Bolinopsis microptera TaxID=2820187 RepID=UPI00307B0B15